MLTVLEILIIAAIIPVIVWALLPIRRVPRFLDFLPLVSVIFMVLHLFIDKETLRLRFIPLYIFTIIVFLATIVRIFRHNPDQPKHRVLAALGRLSALLALAVCTLIPVIVLPNYSSPEPTGNFNVGTVTCDFTDKNRIETYSEIAGRQREIAVQFWYPTDRAGSKVQYNINGAPVSALQEKYPVLIFSHGAFGVRRSNASTCRELASHGYIVASIDHTYHAFYSTFADGRRIPASMNFLKEVNEVQSGKLTVKNNFEITHAWLNTRTADINLVVDNLIAGISGDTGELLNGHVDIERIGLFGHSLGGAAAVQVCRERNDIKAAIVIDGTMIGDVTGVDSDNKEIITNESFKKPLMLMYGSLYHNPEAKATGYLPNINAFNKATDTAYSLCIKNSGHLNFTDLPRISPVLAGQLGTGSIDSLECIKIVNAYALAFFDRHLKGQPSPLLDGLAVYKEAEFEKRTAADQN